MPHYHAVELLALSSPERFNVASLFRSLSEAVDLVADGDSIAITKLNPVAALHALVVAGRKGLRVVGVPTAGFGADLLAVGGALASVEAGALVIGNHGTAPNVIRGIEEGQVKLIESSCPMIELQLLAGMSGLTFTQVPGLAGSDILARRLDILSAPDPFDPGYEVFLAPALRPDVAIVHGLRADPQGNVVVSTLTEDRLIAKASKRVIATVEVVSDDALANLSPEEEVVPEMYFDAISVVPGGARPFACPGHYDEDLAAIGAWMTAARSTDTMLAHLASLTREPANA